MTSMAAIPAQFQMGFLLSFLELWSLEISEMEISPGRTWGSTVRETKSPRPSTAHPRKSKPGPRLATVAVSRFTALGCVELAFLFLLPWSITFCHRLLFLMTKSEGLLVLLVRSPLSDSERRENREREGESESSVDKRPTTLPSKGRTAQPQLQRLPAATVAYSGTQSLIFNRVRFKIGS
ncbi:uncharacterized protein LOC133707925 isoform X5 [Rosa rugosa]|uniref:uncharacterized protein LOC133707925 isoform X5 n=1 Tax=Rosa rugosa TaxID=74645 RepID=UPI002B4099CE|nr:uncharacterized protein LOC133707925 isoform X5 [Rosa rugosa]